MKHKMKLLENPFNKMLNGRKDIEFRLYGEKRKKLKIGDTIEFSKLPNLTEKYHIFLYKSTHFADFYHEYLKSENLLKTFTLIFSKF